LINKTASFHNYVLDISFFEFLYSAIQFLKQQALCQVEAFIISTVNISLSAAKSFDCPRPGKNSVKFFSTLFYSAEIFISFSLPALKFTP